MKKTIFFSVISYFLISTFVYATKSDNFKVRGDGWKAGVAKVVITPQESIWMAGYASRDHSSEGTLHDLWAKALVLEDANGERSVLISSDLVGFSKVMSDSIRDKLEAKFGLSRAQIVLNSSHTHSGPCMMKGIRTFIYELDSNQLEKVEKYGNILIDKIVNVVGDALNSMQPVQVYSQNGITRFQVNRRNNNESKMNSQTELNGPNDYAVPVIKVENREGELVAIAFGYACHATVLDIYKWSGDYPGFAQLELEKLHPGVTALFFQGGGGDQNPLPRRTVALAQQYGSELAAAVERVLNEDMQKLQPTLSTAYSEIELELTAPPTKKELLKMAEEASGYQKRLYVFLLDKIEKGESLLSSYPYPVQVWNLGNQTIVILGGELLIDYSIRLKQILGEDIFVLGYSNDVMAYIPSARVIGEGGYEGEISQVYKGFPNTWKPNIEVLIIQEVLRLAKELEVTKTY